MKPTLHEAYSILERLLPERGGEPSARIGIDISLANRTICRQMAHETG
jgi:hypothetical protein